MMDARRGTSTCQSLQQDRAARWSVGAVQVAEAVLETLPGIQALSAHNVIVVWR